MNTTQTNQIDSCPACDCDEIDRTLEEFAGVCTMCGFVVHEATETTAPDWLVVDDQGMDGDEEAWLAASKVRNATEQRLTEAFRDLEMLGTSLMLPATLRRTAAEIYCEAVLAETTDGRDGTTVIAACTRLASLESEQAVPASRIIEAGGVNEKEFYLGYSAVCDDLDRVPPTPDATDYLPFIARELDIGDEAVSTARQAVAEVSDDPTLVGKDPAGTAGAAIYFADEDSTQANVADASGVSTETIRQRVAQLKELMDDD